MMDQVIHSFETTLQVDLSYELKQEIHRGLINLYWSNSTAAKEATWRVCDNPSVKVKVEVLSDGTMRVAAPDTVAKGSMNVLQPVALTDEDDTDVQCWRLAQRSWEACTSLGGVPV